MHLFVAPTPESPQYSLLQQRFPGVTTTYIGIVNPDRDRFYRQWGFGFRYSKFHSQAVESPETLTLTLGQDELITGGQFQSIVARFDAFYPLPVGSRNGQWWFLYIFGTASLRLSTGDDKTPLILERAPDTVNAYENTVTIVAKASTRDTYRIGIGVDLVNLMRSKFKAQ